MSHTTNEVIKQMNREKDERDAYAMTVLEFGFLAHERGWNLERTRQEFFKISMGKK